MIRNAVAVVVLLCLTLAGASLWRQLDRPVHSVRVEGTLSPAEQGAIREVVSGSVGGGLLSLDTLDLSQRIRALSWPRSVAIRRVWPDGLVIRVEKESVVAAWGDGGYVTSAGKIVQLADGVPDVPVLATAIATPRRAMEVYQMLQSRVAPAGFSIVRLEEDPLGEWLMTFRDGMTVALGNETLNERLDRFLLAYRRALSARRDQITHVDLRYQNGLAVAWADDSKVAAGAAAGAADGRSHGYTEEQPGTQYALR